MSRFSGPQGKGAMRRVREQKRQEAEERNSQTPPERTRRAREQKQQEATARRKRRMRGSA